MPLTTTFAGAGVRGLGWGASAAGSAGVFDIIVPTSVSKTGSGSTPTIGSNGTVSFSGITSVTLNGVFSSAYDNYQIVLNYTSSGYLLANLASGGTITSNTADYNYQYQQASSTSLSPSSSTVQGYWIVNYLGATYKNAATMQVFQPFKTAPTSFSSQGYGNTSVYFAAWGTHELSSSYDGISFSLTVADTLSGSAAVYGLGV